MRSLATRLKLVSLQLIVAVALLSLPLGSARAAATFNNWSSSGPFPTPAKGAVRALAIAPTSSVATVYAGADGGGIFTMGEGGTVWSATNTGLTDREIRVLGVHPFDPQLLYAGSRGGAFRSSDGGLSWTPLAGGLTGGELRGIAIDPQNPSTVYAATDSGVFKSIDDGSVWSAANTGLTSSNIRALLIDPTATATLYAATDQGVFKSGDGAASWSPASSNLLTPDVLCLAYAATTPAATIFAGTNGGGVFASSDGAATWTADNATLGNLTVNAILVDKPSAPTLAYAGTVNGLYKRQYSSGSWSGWAAASNGMTVPAVIHALACDPATPATVYAGTDLGAYRSSNSAGSWSALSGGILRGKAVAIKPSDATVVVAGFGGGGLYRSTDSGGSWLATGDDTASRLFATDLLYDPTGSALYAASGSGVFKSTSDGATWTDISATLAARDVRCLATGSGYPLLAGTSQGVFVWNGTDTWAPYGAGQPSNAVVTSLLLRGSSLFAGTGGGGVFRSDGGGSWQQQNAGLTSTVIEALAADASYVYAGTAAGVFRSGDNGSSWNAINNGIANQSIRTLAASGGTPAFLTAGSSGGGGVYFSTNSGDLWTAMNTGLTDESVNALSASGSARRVYAATAGAKLFALNLSPVSVVTPAAPLSSAPVSFGNINISDTKSVVFSLFNSGTLQLKISALTLAGTDVALFSLSAGGGRACNLAALPNLTVEAGDYCTVSVDFSPSSAGSKTANLAAYSNAPNQPVTTYLAGSGGFPPQATIGSPVSGATVRNPALIFGTAIDSNQTNGSAGTGATLSKVEISTDNGASWQSATKDATLNSWTKWSYSWSATPLPPNGPYVISARATDGNGFTQTVLSSIPLTVDNTPPVTTITASPKLLDNSGSGSFGFTVNKAGSTSVCQLDGGTRSSCSSPFAYAALADGSHTFSVRSTDAIGNVESAAQIYSWVIDTVPPITSIAGTPALITPLSDATFSFSASEAGSSFQCTLDGVSAPCTTPSSYSNLPDGNHTFTVQATDPAGNTAATSPTAQSYSWIVDKNGKPTSTIAAPLAPLTGTSYVFSGTAADPVSGVKSVSLAINNGTPSPATDSSVSPAPHWSSWNYLWSLPVNGTYGVQVQAVDNAGNLQATPISANIIVANPLPVAQIVSPADGALIGSGTPRVITGTALAAGGGLPLQKVQVAVFPTANPPATLSWVDVNGTGTWNYNWQFPADGGYTIQARVLDTAPNMAGVVTGNLSPVVSRNVTVDTTAPVSTITPIANPYLTGQLISLSGTADDPAGGTGVKQVAISITNPLGQTSSGIANYNSTGKSWSYTSGVLADGAYQVQVLATDNAGNLQATPANLTVTLDNVPPVTTITAKPVGLASLPSATFSFTANEPATFTCTLDGASAPCVCSSATAISCTQNYSGLASGPHTFSVLAKDTAGNLETTPKGYSWSVDLVPPLISGATPADGSKRLSVGSTKPRVTFSKDMEPASINGATFYLDHGATGTVSYDPATRSAVFTPNGPLAYATTYTATVTSGVADPANNHIASSYSWSFSTDPDGDVNLDGKVDIADAILCLQMAVGAVQPSADQLRHGDLSPFKDGKPLPDGKIDASDAMMILERVVGNVTW